MRIARGIDVDAPTHVVWGLTLDLVGIGDAAVRQGRAQLLDDGPVGPGTRVRIEQLGLPARVWTVEQFDWPSFVSWTTPLAGGTVRAVHVIAPGPAGRSHLTLRVDAEGGAAPALAALAAPLLRRVLDAQATDLRLAAATTSIV